MKLPIDIIAGRTHLIKYADSTFPLRTTISSIYLSRSPEPLLSARPLLNWKRHFNSTSTIIIAHLPLTHSKHHIRVLVAEPKSVTGSAVCKFVTSENTCSKLLRCPPPTGFFENYSILEANIFSSIFSGVYVCTVGRIVTRQYNCSRVYMVQDKLGIRQISKTRVRLSDYKMNESEFQISVWHHRTSRTYAGGGRRRWSGPTATPSTGVEEGRKNRDSDQDFGG